MKSRLKRQHPQKARKLFQDGCDKRSGLNYIALGGLDFLEHRADTSKTEVEKGTEYLKGNCVAGDGYACSELNFVQQKIWQARVTGKVWLPPIGTEKGARL